MQQVYSYHTFIMPFCWDTQKISDLNDVFCVKNVGNKNNQFWQCMDNDFHQYLRNGENLDMNTETARNFYMEYQIYNQPCRHIMYNYKESNIVHNYVFNPAYLQNATYEILVKEFGVLVLQLNAIKLKIFSTGMALFCLDCSNTEPAQSNMESVKRINEYGRRVSLSFWPGENGFKKCADKISLNGIAEVGKIEDDFSGFIHKAKGLDSFISLDYITHIIRKLLNLNPCDITFRAKETKLEKELTIRPVLDGKMFVSTLVVDEEKIKELQENYQEDTGEFSVKSQMDLVEMVDVELAGCSNRYNSSARLEFLKKTLYLDNFSKTEENVSIMAINQDSVFKIIAKDDYRRRYHIHIHNNLIMLALVQRTSIAIFQDEIARLSYGIEDPKKSLSHKIIAQIMGLQERFVSFQNQILLYEVTPQKEGSYIYTAMQQCLFVREENEVMASRIQSVYELSSIQQGYLFNKWALVTGIIALIYTIVGGMSDAHSIGDGMQSEYLGMSINYISWALCIVCVTVVLTVNYKKHK